MKVILCGYHWIGCKVLQKLLAAGHEVFVFTHDAPYFVPSVADYCGELNVPFSTKNISKSSLPFQPDVVCSIYYRFIIKHWIIDACDGKIFNLHPSILPQYKGCSSLTWAMLNGEKLAGFTYHYIDEGIDTGNIILQRPIEIEPFDTQATLYARAMFEAANHFDQALAWVAAGDRGIPQEKSEDSYFQRGCPHDGAIDPAWDETQVRRFIRAMVHPPYPPARWGGRDVFTFEDYQRLRNQ